MNDIAIRLGWVAINASRIETLIAYLQVVLGKEDSDVVGAPWSSNYDSCKGAYRQLHDTALRCGDSAEAERCRLFLNLLIELNGYMLDRHHVLHAIWEQDPALEPGMTLALSGVHQSGVRPAR